MKPWGNEFAKYCICTHACQHNMDNLNLVFGYDGWASFDTGAAVPQGSCGRPNAQACCCQGWCCWEGMNAICSIALIVPFTQNLMSCCFKRWPLCFPSNNFVTATRTSAVILHTSCNLTLPLVATDWALPLSPEVTARKHLLRRLSILVVVPVLRLARCFGSKRAVLTYSFPLTVWAFGASCAVMHTGLPDMQVSCWTVGAEPHDFQVAVRLDLDAAKQNIVVGVPLLLQMRAELTDVWQAWLKMLALLLLWTCCCGIAIHFRGCSSMISFEADIALSSTSCCATSPTCLWLTEPLFTDAESACASLSSTRSQPNVMLPANPSPEHCQDLPTH